MTAEETLVQLRPRSRWTQVTRSHTALVTDEAGMIHRHTREGLYVHQTRLLSHHRILFDGHSLAPAALSPVEQHSWMGYFTSAPPGDGDESDAKNSTVELRLARFVGEGMHEELTITNFTGAPVEALFQIELDADFLDERETIGPRKTHGRVARSWNETPAGPRLTFDYHAEHTYSHQGNHGTARIHRGLELHIRHSDSEPEWLNGALCFRVALEPFREWHLCSDFIAVFEGNRLPLPYRCGALGSSTVFDEKTTRFLHESARFTTGRAPALASVVQRAADRARRDLAALRIFDEGDDAAWVPAAGAPTYLAYFGRDTLITGWQAAPVSQVILRGSLNLLTRTQATRTDEWRDAQPGRMIHQIQSAPASALQYDPFGLYYGTISAPLFFAEALFSLWIYTGDESEARRYIDPALKGLDWMEQYADEDGDGFYEFRKRSEGGLKNQCWKDSSKAIVYEDGREVPDPIATGEMQASAYVAKKHLALLLYWLGEKDTAKRLSSEADDLKRRFNERFWMEDLGYYAMGIDPQGKLVRSITSDAGAMLLSGIIDEDRAARVADRLMAEDMFSGWGVRTLSSRHRAYNPFSYQRGTVWPVENAMIALAFLRYGLREHAERLIKAQFEAAALFAYDRLPEVFSGHPRDEQHPFPVPYLDADWPQAWSASAIFSYLQTLVGLVPFAPLNSLVVDPQLPEWLPELVLQHLHVGQARCTIRFFREKDGGSSYEVLEKEGPLHIVRQPSPWSLTAGLGERLKDLLASALPGK